MPTGHILWLDSSHNQHCRSMTAASRLRWRFSVAAFFHSPLYVISAMVRRRGSRELHVLGTPGWPGRGPPVKVDKGTQADLPCRTCVGRSGDPLPPTASTTDLESSCLDLIPAPCMVDCSPSEGLGLVTFDDWSRSHQNVLASAPPDFNLRERSVTSTDGLPGAGAPDPCHGPPSPGSRGQDQEGVGGDLTPFGGCRRDHGLGDRDLPPSCLEPVPQGCHPAFVPQDPPSPAPAQTGDPREDLDLPLPAGKRHRPNLSAAFTLHHQRMVSFGLDAGRVLELQQLVSQFHSKWELAPLPLGTLDLPQRQAE